MRFREPLITFRQFPMSQRIGDLLVAAGVLDRAALQQAVAEREHHRGQLGRCIVELGLVGEETYVRALSAQLQLPAVALDSEQIATSVVRTVPRETCERYGLVPFRLDAKRKLLDVAMADASSNEAIDVIEEMTKFRVRPFVAGPQAVDRVLETHGNGAEAVASPPPPAPLPNAAPPAPPPPPPKPSSRLAPVTTPIQDGQRVEDLEAAVRRLEGLVLSLVGLLVERHQVDPEELARRMADAGGKKGR